MSISMLPISGLAPTSMSTTTSRPLGGAATGQDGVAWHVRTVQGEVQNDQQQVDQRGAEAARRATTSQQAADELGNAKAAMTRDLAVLSQARSRARVDVYT